MQRICTKYQRETYDEIVDTVASVDLVLCPYYCYWTGLLTKQEKTPTRKNTKAPSHPPIFNWGFYFSFLALSGRSRGLKSSNSDGSVWWYGQPFWEKQPFIGNGAFVCFRKTPVYTSNSKNTWISGGTKRKTRKFHLYVKCGVS